MTGFELDALEQGERVAHGRWAIIWPRQYGKTEWMTRREAALLRIVQEDRELLDRLERGDQRHENPGE